MRSSDLDGIRFPQRRAGSRYSLAAVDRFVGECRHALYSWERGLAPALSSTEVVLAQFPHVGFFGIGYDADAVDDLLDRVTMQLRSFEPESASEKAQEAELRGMLDEITKLSRDDPA